MEHALIVEDQLSNLHVFSVLLTAQGYSVTEATCGQEAIEICSRYLGTLDLLLADVGLPDMSGTEVALRVRQFHPEAVILLVSGVPLEAWSASDIRNFKQLQAAGADFLEKPFRASTMESKIALVRGFHVGIGT